MDQLQNMNEKRRHLIGYFDSKESPDYENFLKVARALKEDCVFHTGFDPVFQNLRSGQNKAIFKAAKAKSSEPDLVRFHDDQQKISIVDLCFRPSQESSLITISFMRGHKSIALRWSEKSPLKMPRSSLRRDFLSSFSSTSQRMRRV